MAKKHVNQYYLEQQNVYLESLENAKDFDDALKGGFIEQEQYDQAKKDLQIIKNNYETLSYIMFLLNKPNRKKDEKRDEEINKSWYDYLKGHSREALRDESYDALYDFKRLVKGVKEKKND